MSPDLGGPNIVSDWVTGKTEFPGYLAQLWIQAKAVGITIVWTAVVAFVSYKITDLVVGLRVTEEEERAVQYLTSGPSERKAAEDLAWALLNSKEFLFRR